MKVDAQCPRCGLVVKRSLVSGRYESHRWINGCELTVPSTDDEQESHR